MNNTPLANFITFAQASVSWETSYGYIKIMLITNTNELYQIKMQWKCGDLSVDSEIRANGNEYSLWVTEIAGLL